MGISKVIYGDRTLIDLTNDTVSPESLLLGETAHDASGELIVGTAATGGGSNKILKNQTLTFVNLVATITDSDITANSNFIVYYYDETAAENANITAVATTGVITFTAETTPTNSIVCDIVLLDVSSGGGSGSVHTYSTIEQEVGVWIDNRTIYERTFDLGSDLSCLSGVWTDTEIPKGLILHIVNAQLQGNDGTLYTANVNASTNEDIGIYNPIGSAIGVRYITLQYTKNVTPPVHYIEYIESTGGQYINTGIIPTTHSSFEIVLSDVKPTSGEAAIFATGAYSSNSYLMTRDSVNGAPLVWYYPSKQIITTDTTSKHKVELYRGSITLDDVVISDNTTVGSTSFRAVTIFNVSNGYFSSYKLYSFKIYENGNLIFKGLPAKDSNDVVCLYDVISGQYLYNEGSGSFVAGEDI